jgi:hypothetical protein
MELEADMEASIVGVVRGWVVKGLDETVRGAGHGAESRSKALDTLVVVGRHVDGGYFIKPRAKGGTGYDVHGMAVAVVVVIVDVLDGARMFVGDVVVQRAAAGDVKDLGAAADTEEWDASGEASSHELELDAVLVEVEGSVAGVLGSNGGGQGAVQFLLAGRHAHHSRSRVHW